MVIEPPSTPETKDSTNMIDSLSSNDRPMFQILLTKVREFFQESILIIFSPRRFFLERRDAINGEYGTPNALAFAIICTWIASGFSFIWSSAVHLLLSQKIKDFFHIAGDVLSPSGEDTIRISTSLIPGFDQLGAHFYNFIFSAGSLILSPFFTLFHLLLAALGIHLGVKLFIKDGRPVRFSTTLKILSYCSATALLCIIPGVGLALSLLLWLIASIIGFSIVYQVSIYRALAMVFAPSLILLLVGMIAIFSIFILGVSLLKLAI